MEQKDFIKFLGTGGARFVVAQQLRASGGIWLSSQGVQVLIDPGPGSLVRGLTSEPKLEPLKLDGVILTHRHLDHAADVNIMIEAMTDGGFQKRGVLFAPSDALDHDPVVLQYVRSYLNRIEVLREGQSYNLGSLHFSTPVRHNHPVETYGLKFFLPQGHLSLIADTLFFPELSDYYQAPWVIINVLLPSAPPKLIYHLTLDDVKTIVLAMKPQPRKAFLTHFGTSMLRARPCKLAEELSGLTGVQIIACDDGMSVNLNENS